MARRALVIGVDDYAFAPLSSCVNDATAIRDLLIELGMFECAECTLMTSPMAQGSVGRPTRKAILDWLLVHYESNTPLDRLFVYFAGHGLSIRLGREADALRTALVPAGVDALKNSGGEMVDLDELVGRFARRGALEQYWIVDACRNMPPEGTLLNVATIGWDVPAPGDPREARQMAQAVLYAVAPLAMARSAKQGHGLLTGHILNGLAGRNDAQWGAAGYYDENRDTWLISIETLSEHAVRRIGADLAPDAWQRDYDLPQVWQGERKPGPLRDAGTLPDRQVALFVDPTHAASALSVSLSVKRNKVAAWPPNVHGQTVALPPERYRLTVELASGAAGWKAPRIAQPVLDVRETDRIELAVEPETPAPVGPRPPPDPLDGVPFVALPTITEQFIPPVFVPNYGNRFSGRDHLKYIQTPDDGHYELQPPTLTVHAIDPGATVRLTRLSGGRERRDERVETRIIVSEGIWRIEVMLGADVIAVHEEDVANGHHYNVVTVAQITPALAALLPEAERTALAAGEPRTALAPSESIGPMQGAILATLLPMLALKPFDTAGAILSGFSPRLGIPTVPSYSDAPAALAVAFDGPWPLSRMHPGEGAEVIMGGPAELVWRDPSGRVQIFVHGTARDHDGLILTVPGWGRLDVGLPRVAGYCATVAAALWPDGRRDLSVSLFILPPGADQVVRPGRLSRALAIATRLYRAGATLDEVDYDVFSQLSWGSWGDPILGALAWFGNRRHYAASPPSDPKRRAQLEYHQGAVSAFLARTVPHLADTRVIGALSQPSPAREDILDHLLSDAVLGQPVLAEAVFALARHAISRGRLDHWSVTRFQHLAADAVFNAVWLPPLPIPKGGRS